MSELLTDPDFGDELRRRRIEKGLSLAKLADEVDFSKSYLSKVENGAQRPSDQLARISDRVLGADGALVALARERASPTDVPRLDAPGSASDWVLLMDADGRTEFQARSAGSADPGGLTWTMTQPSGGAPALAAMALELYALLAQFRQLGQRLPPTTMAQMLIPQLGVLRRALDVLPGGDKRAEVARVAARFAEYVGWMAQEKGDYGAAIWWTRYSVDLAQLGGDDELAHYALVRRAEMALYEGDCESTVALASEAYQASANHHVRGLAAQREAQGHALAGAERLCREALERAAKSRLCDGGAATSAGSVFGSEQLRDPLAFATGWCLHDLTHYEPAAALLAGELAALAPSALRAQARCGARLALAYAHGGELEQACRVAGEVVAVAQVVDSSTVRSDLRQLMRAVRRHRDQRDVSGLMPGLTGALRSSN